MTINNRLMLIEGQTVLVTGGAGFIGGALITFLLERTNLKIINLDKLGYASDLSRINTTLNTLKIPEDRYKFICVDLTEREKIFEIVQRIAPDFVFHLAAESHVDNSIESPDIFLQSNVVGTFNLLEAVKNHWLNMTPERKDKFRFLHVSTDEVFGSLGPTGLFAEETAYNPRSPYSASKAASDHFVKAYFHTYNMPIIVTNCTNNYGPWQYPEKLIPVIILNGLNDDNIPLYGDGEYIRDWIFVNDHIEALFLVMKKGIIGSSYCIGSSEEHTNNEIAESICDVLDSIKPSNKPHSKLIKNIRDRAGHDRRYAINSFKIRSQLGWRPKYNFEVGIKETIFWYSKNLDWCKHCSSLGSK